MTDPTPQPMAPQAAAPLSESEDRQWASFAHLGGIIGFLPSLIIWLVFKDRGRFTNSEAKEALNFQITAAIAQIVVFILNSILTAATFGLWALIGWILPLAVWVISLIWSIQGFLKTKDGVGYRYPASVRLIK
jgi:uncharacterized Tic20 family protein